MKLRTARAALLAALTIAAGAACGGPRTMPIDPPPETSGAGVIGTVPPRAGVLPVDVLIEGRLHRAGGGEIPLGELLECSGYCHIGEAWRVPDGWLVGAYTDGRSGNKLWRVPESGDPTLLADGQYFMVGRGTAERPGVQVAWLADGRLHLGTYAQGQLTRVVSTTAPEVPVNNGLGPHQLYPQVVVGDALVLAGTQTGGGLDIWDVWFPSRGDYRPDTYPVIGLHGTTPDGVRIIATYLREPSSGSREVCLGELDPEDFEAVRSRCPAPFPDFAHVYPSPDDRWWIVQHPVRVDLYDAGQVWSGSGPVWSLPALGVWLDATSFVVLDGSLSFVGYTDGRPDQPLPQTVGPLTPWGVVVDLRGET